VKSVFEKHRFHDGLVWTEGLEIKAAFSNFASVVWMLPNKSSHDNEDVEHVLFYHSFLVSSSHL